MKLIAGLGNPGPAYVGTRHNAGFSVVEELARRRGASWRYEARFEGAIAEASLGGQAVRLLKPLTYMNLSGRSVGPLLRYYKTPLEDLLVVSDDMDLAVGTLRLRADGSAGGQKGLADVIRDLGSEAFARLRVGIGRSSRGDAADFVLSRFSPAERELMDDTVRLAADAVECWATRGVETAMNRYNKRKSDERRGESRGTPDQQGDAP